MADGPIYDTQLEAFLLWACRETGILAELLDGPKRPEKIAQETGVTEHAADVSLAALREMGYLRQSGERYEATERLDGFRPETDVLEKGILPHRIDSLEHYMRLPEIMRTGEPPEHSEGGLEKYQGAMATVDESIVRAIVTAAEHVHPRPDHVLEVGSGPGGFTREFRRRGATVTAFDLPPVVDLLSDHYAEDGIELVAGDARESLPTGFDLVFSARMILFFSPEELRAYFENAYEALEPGGTFVCNARVIDRSEGIERFAVHMLTVTAGGHMHTAGEYESALEGAGFVDPEVRSVPGTPFHAIVGHKPERS